MKNELFTVLFVPLVESIPLKALKRPSAKVLQLSLRQEQLLSGERNRHQVSQQLRLRINIILQASAGISNNELVKRLHTTYHPVLHWRNHWFEHQAA